MISDGVIPPPAADTIKHFDPSHPEYYVLPPRERAAADVLNALQISAPLKKGGKPVPHVAGYESYVGQGELMQKGYGLGKDNVRRFGPRTRVRTFGISDCNIGAGCGVAGALGCIVTSGIVNILDDEIAEPFIVPFCLAALGCTTEALGCLIANADFGSN